MTTAHSSLRELKAHADKIATTLKAVARGEHLESNLAHKLAESLARETVTFGVVMDDKVLKITMTWALIRDSSQAGISEYIVDLMRESRDTVH